MAASAVGAVGAVKAPAVGDGAERDMTHTLQDAPGWGQIHSRPAAYPPQSSDGPAARGSAGGPFLSSDDPAGA